jgi:hypothetical protein
MKTNSVRMPVIYKGTPMMPMKASRVNRFVKEGKGKIRYDRKLNIHYLQLLVPPSDYQYQNITLGIDPGSTFDGFSVVSAKSHHVNIELIQRPKKGRNSIKAFKENQATNRRTRRGRLRSRRARFDNRTSNKVTPTIRANVEFRQWLVTRLLTVFPITHVVIEDVAANHSLLGKAGRAFSLVEQGKNMFYEFLKAKGLNVELYKGYDTCKLRKNSFGYDPKVKSKDSKVFNAHCIDSFVMACEKEINEVIDMDTGEITNQPKITNMMPINKRVIFIEKIVKIRRRLTRTRALYSNTTKNNQQGPNYYRYKKGGIPVVFKCKSNKDNVARVKPNGVTKSNHPTKWEYIDNGRAVKQKCNTAKYGGTTLCGHKFYDTKKHEWLNRKIIVKC